MQLVIRPLGNHLALPDAIKHAWYHAMSSEHLTVDCGQHAESLRPVGDHLVLPDAIKFSAMQLLQSLDGGQPTHCVT